MIESLYVKTVISSRRFINHEQICTIIPHTEGEVGFNLISDKRTEIIPIEGISVETRYVPDGSVHQLLFPKPLKKGRPYKFAYMERFLEDDPIIENQDWAGQSFILPALKYIQEVVFEGDKPAVTWAYDKMTYIEKPGEPEDHELIRISEDGIIKKEFLQLHSGLHSGIAWRWEEL